MAMRVQSGGDDLDEVHEINVTPFIDVMLVLLIIFMVAAPLATVDVAVDLPVSTAEPQPRDPKPIFLTLKENHALALGEVSQRLFAHLRFRVVDLALVPVALPLAGLIAAALLLVRVTSGTFVLICHRTLLRLSERNGANCAGGPAEEEVPSSSCACRAKAATVRMDVSYCGGAAGADAPCCCSLQMRRHVDSRRVMATR